MLIKIKYKERICHENDFSYKYDDINYKIEFIRCEEYYVKYNEDGNGNNYFYVNDKKINLKEIEYITKEI